MRQQHVGQEIGALVELAFRETQAAYRVIDNDTIVPNASEQEGAALVEALDVLKSAGLDGARAHLKQAGEELSTGRFAKSVAESIHAVESVARAIEANANTLDPALKRLRDKIGIHPALVQGFGNLYGYTSDEQGVRHALIEGAKPNVDQYDALFMLGACAAFCTYLVGKSRDAGLIKV
jgi:hypothetical protein